MIDEKKIFIVSYIENGVLSKWFWIMLLRSCATKVCYVELRSYKIKILLEKLMKKDFFVREMLICKWVLGRTLVSSFLNM